MSIDWKIIAVGSQIAGLVINYLADVLPTTRRLSGPMWWPLKSRKLREYFSSLRVLAVQLAAGASTYWLTEADIAEWNVASLATIFGFFLLVIVIDIEHRVILHPVSFIGGILLGWQGIHMHGFTGTIIGGLAGFGMLLAIYWLGDRMARRVARRRGNELEDKALGFGDVILAGVIGLLLGWPGVVGGLILGIFLAGLYSALHILWRMLRKDYEAFATIPLGPFLSLGAIATILLAAYS